TPMAPGISDRLVSDSGPPMASTRLHHWPACAEGNEKGRPPGSQFKVFKGEGKPVVRQRMPGAGLSWTTSWEETSGIIRSPVRASILPDYIGTSLPSAKAAGCPQLAEADVRA